MIGKNIFEVSRGIEKTGIYGEYLKVLKTGELFQIDDLIPQLKFFNIHILVSAFKVGGGFGIIFSDKIVPKNSTLIILLKSYCEIRNWKSW